MSEPARVDPLVPAGFSLFRGGLLYTVGLRIGLVGDDRRLIRLGFALAFLTWVPLAVLNTLERAMGGSSIIPFWESVGTHVRLLLTIPLFFFAEDMFDSRAPDVLRRILRIGLILPKDEPRFGAAVRQAVRTRDSWLVEIAIFVMTVGLIWSGVRTDLPGPITTWRATLDGQTTPAGWWYGIVSIPIFQFLLWRWCWRFIAWARLLWRISRLNLQLIATHPDGGGGLAVLGVAHVDLAPLATGAAAVLASSYAEQMLFAGAEPSRFVVSVTAAIVGGTLGLILPLFFFTPKLIEAKQQALLDYGDLAAEYTRAFAMKWVYHDRRPDEHLLGTADLQSLADLGNSFALIRNMTVLPMGRYQVTLLAAATALPFAPLVLLAFPLDRLLIDSLKSLSGIP
jgi:hypothetical protein